MKTLSRVYTALILFFLYAPIIVLVVFSFNSSDSTGVFSGFSLKWYRELFRNGEIMRALKNTLVVALLSSLIATDYRDTCCGRDIQLPEKMVQDSGADGDGYTYDEPGYSYRYINDAALCLCRSVAGAALFARVCHFC